MKWFKKRKKDIPIKMDMSRYKMSQTIGSLVLFEHLANKSFFKVNDDDLEILLYAMFIKSNENIKITFSQFDIMIKNERFSNWLISSFNEDISFRYQKISKEENDMNDDKKEDLGEITITQLASMLIIKCHLDPSYVMNEMQLWEINNYFELFDMEERGQWERERLWTYFTILPHIDGKKMKSPEKLIEFAWEKGEKEKKANKGIENNRFAFNNMIGKNIFGDNGSI